MRFLDSDEEDNIQIFRTKNRFEAFRLDEDEDFEVIQKEEETIDLTQSEEESVDKLFSDDSTEAYESPNEEETQVSPAEAKEVEPVEEQEENEDYHMVNAVDLMAEPFERMHFERKKRKRRAKRKAFRKAKRQRKRKKALDDLAYAFFLFL